MKRQLPWFGWVGVILCGVAVLTAVVEQSVTLRGVLIAVAGVVLAGVGWGLRRPAPAPREPASLPKG